MKSACCVEFYVWFLQIVKPTYATNHELSSFQEEMRGQTIPHFLLIVSLFIFQSNNDKLASAIRDNQCMNH